MKISIKNFALISLLIFSQFTYAQKTTLYGNYSENIVSMCEQGCEFYELGAFMLTEKLQFEDNSQLARSIPVMAIGDIVKTKELPTIAGPNADKSQYGVYEEVERFKVEDYFPMKVLEYSISKENYDLYKSGKDYILDIQVKSPISIDMKLKIAVESGEYSEFKVLANQTAELKYTVKNNGYTLRPKVVLTKSHIDVSRLPLSVFDEAKQTGIMLYFEEYPDIETLQRY